MVKWKQQWERWKQLNTRKKIQCLVLLALAAIILLIYGTTLVPEKQVPLQAEPQKQAEDLEEKLCAILGKVEGAGRVEVIINYDSGTELVPALREETRNSSDSNGTANSQTTDKSTEVATIKQNGDTTALIVKEIQPVVRGVLVVSEGAGNIGVRMQLLEAVETFLDIEADRVEVLKMHPADA